MGNVAFRINHTMQDQGSANLAQRIASNVKVDPAYFAKKHLY